MALPDRGSISDKAPYRDQFGGQIQRRFPYRAEQRRLSPPAPRPRRLKYSVRQWPPSLVWTFGTPSVLLVGAARFELATPSPPDWCANRAALRSETVATIVFGHFARNIRSPSALPQRKVAIESAVAPSVADQS